MMVRRALPARVWLALLIAVALLPVVMLAGVLVWQADRSSNAAFEQQALSLAQRSSALVDQELVAFQASLQALASSPAILRGDWADFYDQAAAVQAARGAVVVVRDPTGQQFVNTRVPFGTELPRSNDKLLLATDAKIIANGKPEVTDLFTGRVSGLSLVAMMVPVFRNGVPAYSMSMGLPPQAMADLLRRQDVPPDWTVSLIDRQNRVVAQSKDHDRFVGSSASPDVAARTLGDSGTFTGSSSDGTSILASHARSQVSGWHVVVEVPSAVVGSAVWRTTRLIALGLTVATGLAASCATLFARAVNRPIVDLVRAAGLLGRGKPLPDIRFRVVEAETVVNAMQAASRSLRARERHLVEEAQRLDALAKIGTELMGQRSVEKVVQSVIDGGVSLTGAAFGAFFYNVAGEGDERMMLYALSGAPREAFASFPMPRHTAVFRPTFAGEGIIRSDDITKDPRYGRADTHFGMPKGHLPVRSYLAVPVTSGSGEVVGTLLFGHPDAGVFTERHADLVAGIAGLAAVAVDNARLFDEARREIAARKRSEDDLRLLAGELQHRIKNMLAMIGAVANQTFRTAPTKEAAQETFEARLGALAQAQDILTATSWSSAPIREVVDGALRPHRVEQGRFTVSGPDLRLTAKQALSLSLAVHELATNAAKYGALSVEDGRVAVVWEIVGIGPEPEFRLTWREKGGPPTEPPSRKGFGSRLIERTLAGDFGGRVEMRFETNGLVCRMATPVRNLQIEGTSAIPPVVESDETGMRIVA